MKEKDLRVIFELQERLIRLLRVVEAKREEIYEAFPEVISVYPASDGLGQDRDGNSVADEKILETCRIRVELMSVAPGIKERLAEFFPSLPVEVNESDIDPRKQRLARNLARKADELGDAIDSGCYIGIDLDDKGAYFNVSLHNDTSETHQAVQNTFPGERVKFFKGGQSLKFEFR